jgi:hypothetical protein
MAAKKSSKQKRPNHARHLNVAASLKNSWQRIAVHTPRNPHRAFRLTKPRLYRLSSEDFKTTWRLLVDTWAFIKHHKRIMLGLGLLYALLGYFLVGGISQLDYVAFKDASQEVVNGDIGAFGTAFSLFGAALTGNLSSTPSDVQRFLSAALILLFWLSLVWATRMLSASKDITMRDALYSGGAPIIPTLVILAVIAVQLIPAAIGIFGYSTALNGGWLAGGVESMTFAIAAALLSLLSIYFLVSSLTALIIVTLPGTYPFAALRSARELVVNKRWGMILRTLALAVHVVLVWAAVLIPVFLIDNWLRFDWLPLVPIFVQALSGATLVFTSIYIYKLYRSLL